MESKIYCKFIVVAVIIIMMITIIMIKTLFSKEAYLSSQDLKIINCIY